MAIITWEILIFEQLHYSVPEKGGIFFLSCRTFSQSSFNYFTTLIHVAVAHSAGILHVGELTCKLIS